MPTPPPTHTACPDSRSSVAWPRGPATSRIASPTWRCAQLGRAGADRLDHQGDGAGLGIVVGDRQRDALRARALPDDDELAGTPDLRDPRSLDDEADDIRGELLTLDDGMHATSRPGALLMRRSSPDGRDRAVTCPWPRDAVRRSRVGRAVRRRTHGRPAHRADRAMLAAARHRARATSVRSRPIAFDSGPATTGCVISRAVGRSPPPRARADRGGRRSCASAEARA